MMLNFLFPYDKYLDADGIVDLRVFLKEYSEVALWSSGESSFHESVVKIKKKLSW